MSEKQFCPRRAESLVHSDIFPGPDLWERDRWSKNLLWVRTWHFVDYVKDLIKHGKQTMFLGKHNDEWLWRGPVPRTCSYCGGVHPDDAIRLIQDGWEVDGTDKGWKKYLYPPGYAMHAARVIAALDNGNTTVRDDFWSPVPPVKVYVQHFSDWQVKDFNTALKVSEK